MVLCKYKSMRRSLNQKILKLRFLLQCKNLGCIPKFLQFRTQPGLYKFKNIIKNAELKILRKTIRDMRAEIASLELKTYYTFLEVIKNNHQVILDEFLFDLFRILDYDTMKTTNRLNGKLQRLQDNMKQHQDKQQKDTTNSSEYNNFINLSSYKCTEKEAKILNLGTKMAVRPVEDFSKLIPYIENVNDNLPSNLQKDFRGKCVYAINKEHNNMKTQITQNNQYHNILKKLKNNDNIRIIQADKSDSLVLLNETDFQSKLKQTLDELKVEIINKDPTKTLITKIQKLCSRKDITIPAKIDPTIYPAPPKLFVKIKMHKVNHPFRPIVSKCNSPTYNLEKYLSQLLKPLIDQHYYNIESGTKLIDRIKDIELEPTAKLYSLDVISLFPSIPMDKVYDLIIKYCKTHIELRNFIVFIELALRIIFENNYFKINNIIYKQKTGTPMGSPLSTVCSEVIMQFIENHTIPNAELKPQCYLRYVDDIFVIWQFRHTSLISFMDKLGEHFPSIKFTVEREKNKSIPFLDVYIHRTNEGKLWFNTYSKPSSKTIPIPYSSAHPISSKKAFFQAHLNRNKKYTTFDFLEKANIRKLRGLAHKAEYPEQFMQRLVENINRDKVDKITSALLQKPTLDLKYVPAIPFFEFLVPIVKHIKNKHNIIIPFCAPTPISAYIINDRDNTKPSGGIYTIPVKKQNLTFEYIGKTTRNIEVRLAEHKNSLLKLYGNTSLKMFLLNNLDATPIWENTKILTSPRSKNILSWEESVAIAKSGNPINIEPGRVLSDLWQTIMNSTYKKDWQTSKLCYSSEDGNKIDC